MQLSSFSQDALAAGPIPFGTALFNGGGKSGGGTGSGSGAGGSKGNTLGGEFKRKESDPRQSGAGGTKSGFGGEIGSPEPKKGRKTAQS